ncbi:response regulator transcription factor [Flavobacterium sp.]|uniref:response regulator transcription factor n=1 Tax=Flavobacterium sp. TaxID=239 RepID=UPI0026141802|nr:response regulator transcription factor [Flavobacterium sp.]MDD3005164.1 response regulator transcription factor [Flavobacterium sp.]
MNINVGIVEDDKDLRENLMLFINQSEGFVCVHSFSDAESALVNIPKLSLDVVLMDIHLPQKDGITCVKSLVEITPETDYVMCTSFEDTEMVFKALKAGAKGYITKTSSPSKILEAIYDVFHGGSPMNSNIARKVVESFQTDLKKNAELKKLTEREKEILALLSKGYRYKEIASQLFLSTETVRTHVRNIYVKLQVNSRTDALNKTYPK